MGMKFLNKKGWHTGSLQNIERVWKAEEKEKAENQKLDELRKQLGVEREREEFRQLRIQAGLEPVQERLGFLYDEGLSVGNTSTGGFSALQSCPPAAAPTSNSAPTPAVPSPLDSSAPGALFEEKPQSANDAWRKLHSDPLLMIRQREQEALARIKNNPVKMAMIRKSVEIKKKDDEAHDEKQKKVKSKHKRRSSKHQSDTEDDSDEDRKRRRKLKHKDDEAHDEKRKMVHLKHKRHSSKHQSDTEDDSDEDRRRRKSKHQGKDHLDSNEDVRDRERRHRHPHIDGGEKQRHHSPDKHFRRDSEADKGHRSPSKRKPDRNGREEDHLDSNEDVRDRERRHRHPHIDGSEKQRHHSPDKHFRRDSEADKGHRSPSKRKPDGNGREENSRDRSEHHRHSRRESDSGKSRGSPSQQKVDRPVDREQTQRDNNEKLRHENYPSGPRDTKHTAGLPPKHDPSSSSRRKGKAPQLSEEERAARLREMQIDAELHEEQRWKRLKKAEEDDAREATKVDSSRGKSFLDAVQKSVYGAEKGGSSTIEESVRRRSHFLQGRTQVDEQNAFRR